MLGSRPCEADPVGSRCCFLEPVKSLAQPSTAGENFRGVLLSRVGEL